MTFAPALFCALILDAILGEPKWLWDRIPHPAVLIGRAISWLETRFNNDPARRIKGTEVVALLSFAAIALGYGLSLLGPVAEILVAAILLAQKSLTQHVRAVADALRLSVPAGRQAVAMIVGRNTKDMTESDVSRAAIESAAENLSDGVIAPAFWFLVAGLPGLLLYKIVNTADSMIGHRTEQFEKFGWAAARLDDVLNWIPARLTPVLMALAYARLDVFKTLRRDARLHRSPNAGWPEAAIAVLLNTPLSGPRSYDGKRQDFPWVYPEGKQMAGPGEIDQAVAILWRTWALATGLILIIALI
ncbi:adenosylcobinamide-phosphate synthase CbiB [Parasulfitobacter algicola]|uniref:Cobalamin biosynthesis protein CobD n=1 Tax=Parasulfitobacter algicola TaxID=2614809 RepID=A0ABX2INN8_9RHOB|nr:adenosylcobinamide-phosphate synthase CbiB [Sulfitobacter algicola]NSX53975.1 cobalamin biosynthesis protein [Sulfitobacter algicola]